MAVFMSFVYHMVDYMYSYFFFFFSSRRRHTRCSRDWSSDVCSSDLVAAPPPRTASPRPETGIRGSHGRVAASRTARGDRGRARARPAAALGLLRADRGPPSPGRPLLPAPQSRGHPVGVVVLLGLAPWVRRGRACAAPVEGWRACRPARGNVVNPHVVWCVYGTRPEVIKMAPVVWALRARPEAIAVRLVFTGQHRELASDLFTPLAMEPDLALGVMTEDQSLTAVGARCLQAIGHALERDAPALVLVQGDTSTVLFSALAAYFQKVAIGHVEAGLRSFNKYAPFPEEAMRRLTDAVADLHFAATPRAAANLHAEGVDPARIFVTGNTVIDAVQHAADLGEREASSTVRAWARTGGPYVVTTLHRRESFGTRSEEHTSELQSRLHLVCRLLLEKKTHSR